MREFLSHVLESFRDATGWSRDDGYSDLNIASSELLHFQTPRGLRMTLSSLATPHFATSYTLGSIGVVDGAISYLYSSVPLPDVVAQSDRIPLPALLQSYRQRRRPTGLPPVLAPEFLTPPRRHLTLDALLPFGSPAAAAAPAPNPAAAAIVAAAADTPLIPTPPATPTLPPPIPLSTSIAELMLPAVDYAAGVIHEARALVDKPALFYGRLYLPQSMLEAYMVKRLGPSVQLQLRAVSDASLPNGGTLLSILQVDRGRYGFESLMSSDGGLLGIRGLYNFGLGKDAAAASSASSAGSAGPASTASTASTAGSSPTEGASDPRLHHGRFSAGGELYYGTLNKSGGVSLGARFESTATPDDSSGNNGTPLSATMTINPLMGNVGATYAVKAREQCSLATRFDFNVYSYESEWSVGMELWSTRRLAGLVAVDDNREPEPDRDDAAAKEKQLVLQALQAKRKQKASKPAAKPKQENQEKAEKPAQQAKATKAVAESPQAPPAPPAPAPAPEPPTPLPVAIPERSFQAKLEWRLDDPVVTPSLPPPPPPPPTPARAEPAEKQYQGVLKARLDQNLKLGLLWEGRIKSLLFSLGSNVDLHRLDQPFRTLGLQIQFSS